MPQITLTRSQVQSLVSFCESAQSPSFFIAKDRGAYVGVSTGCEPAQQRLFYFHGCNPERDTDYYRNALNAFGGGDFVEDLPLDHLRQAIANPACQKVLITVTTESVRLDALV